MPSQLQRLQFSVSLLDQVTGPAGRMQQSLQSTAQTAQASFAKIGIGAAGLAGAGLAMKSLLMPAIEMDRALGEVKSLGVTNDALQELSNTALEFSIDYGKSATDFVRSSYDIQSAIAGLSGSELSKFTKAGGVLAAATKADTATITDYMGTMYGIFSDTATKMGKAEWVEQLSGQTAMAVQMFKTDGQKMSAAFANLGAGATSMGRSLAEQMAVMGSLQATMSGSESATKYKAFLGGIGKAQQALGLQFTDSQGEMLGMVEILDAIKGKFGDTIDVAEGDALKKAFGTQEAVSLIQLLMKDTAKLEAGINNLGKVKGMEKATEMAAAMVDPWEKLDAGLNAVRVGIGAGLLPVINPLVDSMSSGTKTILRWTGLFPKLTKWVGVGVTIILGLTAAIAILTIASGLSAGAMLAWGIACSTVNGAIALVSGTLKALRTVMLAVNIAMYANPIGLIVAGIAALIGVVAAVIYNWDDLKASFLDTTWGKGLMKIIGGVIDYFKSMSAIAGKVVDWVVEKINMIPGIEIGGGESTAPDFGTVNNQLKTAAVAPGQITNNISRAVNNNSSSSSQGGNQVNIHTTQPPTPQMMDSWMMMEGA